MSDPRLGPVLLLAMLGLASSSQPSSSTPPAPPGGGGAPPPPHPPLPPTDYHRTAHAYAAAKLPALVSRWQSPRVLAALRVYAPHYLPGLPLSAALAFGASSTGPGEDTGGSLSERGLFNVETSYIDRWADDAETRSVLQRAYNPSREAYASDLEAQVFTGMRRYRVALDAAASASSRAVAPAVPVDALAAWCAVTSYSVGAGTLARLFGASSTASTAPRADRPRELAAVVDTAARRGDTSVAGVPMAGVAGAARAIVRPLQRYYSGRDLAAQVEPAAAGWFSLAPIADDVDARLSAIAHGAHP